MKSNYKKTAIVIGGSKEIGKFVRFIVEEKIKYISGSIVYFDGNLNKSFI
tara:strand:+ start:1243 stop:1392 length:150 start_codon:yes stop_codon:yes gene_type:complete